ncbi:UDP-N-acetylglucosamine--LPS N-acetylglucosamine transferase [Deinococcus koreensis]|uniref:UDP-N-acetylglucosamine--LPS N-acetylglucosamine transferase n=1 Tax=Deinococcus koreensis TaxID=2054903 RepID=A0A2K3V2Q0_9DEIO|nr:UDP-N-acetylglucosamine--LPS N-acetylglucosamine transferase [Deinococcus koreensis]
MRALFVTASIGAGHHQAQMAVQLALRARGVALDDRESDVVGYLSAAERSWTVDLYAFELRHAPWLYEWFYHGTDHDRPLSLIEFFCRWVGLSGMRRDIAQTRPELVLSSYWSSVPLAHRVRRQSRRPFVNALVVTDYRAHRHWIRPEADLVMVAAEETREQMIARGLEAGKVVVTGIPISQRFGALIGADKARLRAERGLRPDLPLLLISGGGTGTYTAQERVLTELGNLGRRVQVLVMSGAQRPGVSQVGGATVHSLGFTSDFPELMAASDLVVGKAGGLTVAEATALGVPLVIHEPIPGQEEYNAEYLQRRGAAIWARELSDVRGAVLAALDPDRHACLSAAARAVGVPDAADRVAAALLDRLGRA